MDLELVFSDAVFSGEKFGEARPVKKGVLWLQFKMRKFSGIEKEERQELFSLCFASDYLAG